MTLTKYSGQYEELFSNCVLHWTGSDQTSLGFPILPSGVTVTPNGTWTNDVNLGNNKSCKTFDGSTNYISISDHDLWSIENSHTILTYVKFTSYPADGRVYPIVGQAPTDAVHQEVRLRNISGVYYWDFRCYSTALSKDVTISTIANVSLNTWYHVAFVKNGTNYYIFQDSVNILSTTNALVWNNVAGVLYIGVMAGTVGSYFEGNIKDLMIFKGKALSQDQIAALMSETYIN